ncbi:flavin-containing monooxygenase [Geodermatophilus sp. SYSU D00815]
MTTSTLEHPLDVLVIGAGQAGLALGHHLQRAGARFLLVDAGDAVGHVWRSRWDSLRLFTAAEHDALPGLPFPAPAGTYPTKDEVAAYLAAYAEAFDLPVRLGCRVTRLSRAGEGFLAGTTTGEITARQVVVATGPFQTPHVPALGLAPEVPQLHSAGYRRPDDLPAGAVLVVGAGNSGLQIAEELAAAGRAVTVAVGTRPTTVPQRPLGRDLFWWLTTLGLIRATAGSRLGRRFRGRELVVGTTWRGLRSRGIALRPRAVAGEGRVVRFADGTSAAFDAVLWATGYRPDHSWLDVPGAVVDGQVVHERGISPVPGLAFLGLPWQWTRGSALLGFVGEDAAWLAGRLLGTADARLSPAGAV